ncbi:MAG: site-specific integrase [Sulfuricellaceae bacterium]|nr:site-specific integrase [Sulfuricellaceae bacterium]
MATIRKRESPGGTVYQVQIRMRGFSPESASFERLTDARAWAAKIESDMKAGRHFGASKRHTFGELITRYTKHQAGKLKSWGDTERHLKLWLDLLGDCFLGEITPQRINELRDKMLSETTARGTPRKPATVRRIMAALSSCLGYGVTELQWLERNPSEKAGTPGNADSRVRFLSDEEMERLLLACRKSSNRDLYTAVALSLTTGGRKAEIMGLRWQQIDFKRRLITLGETKNGDARALPLSGEAFELLEARAKVRQLHDDHVFPPTRAAKKSDHLDLRTPWETVLKAAGIDDFHWHDLRHTAASYLVMSGVDLVSVARILGHRQLQMTLRYSHLAPGKIVEHGDMLAERLGLGGKQ